jgi:hypothetical protein
MQRDVPIARTAARTAITAIVLYQMVLVALILIRPDLDPSWHTISEWAVGPHGWVMSLAFLVSALSYAATWSLVRPHLKSLAGRIGIGILGVCVVGATGVGLFTTDPLGTPPTALSTTGILHFVFGTSQLVLLPVAALFITLNLACQSAAWLPARRVLYTIAGVPLLGSLAFAAYTAAFMVPLGPGAYGPGVNIGWPPRVAFLSYAIWVVMLALQALRLRQVSAERLEAAAAPSRPSSC